MKYKKPKNVKSPKNHLNELIETIDFGADKFSLAKLIWNSKECYGIRWNISQNERQDKNKLTGMKECIGTPNSRGHSTWFILPKEFNEVAKKLLNSHIILFLFLIFSSLLTMSQITQGTIEETKVDIISVKPAPFDSLSGWEQDSPLALIGQKIFLPKGAINNFEEDFNNIDKPFLFTLKKQVYRINEYNSFMQHIIYELNFQRDSEKPYLESIKAGAKKSSYIVDSIYTNIYKPYFTYAIAIEDFYGLNRNCQFYINNNINDISNKYYLIIDVITESEFNDYFHDNSTSYDFNTRARRNKTTFFISKKSSKDIIVREVDYPFGEKNISGFLLVDLETNDTIAMNKYHNNPTHKFIVVSQFERAKELCKDSIFYKVTSNNNVNTEDLYKCTLVTVDENKGNIVLAMEDKDGTVKKVTLEEMFKNAYVFKSGYDKAQQAKELKEEELNKIKQEEAAKRKAQEEQELANRRDIYIGKYGEEYGNLVTLEKVKIGMSKEMCVDSWGNPNHKSQELINGHLFEYWYFGYYKFLKFKNGILIGIEE